MKNVNAKSISLLVTAMAVGLLSVSSLHAEEESWKQDTALVSMQGTRAIVCGLDGDKILFKNADPQLAIEWAMANMRTTVLLAGKYVISDSIDVPRDGVTLIVDRDAEISLEGGNEYKTDLGFRPKGHWIMVPLIHNLRHDNVRVISFGTLAHSIWQDKKPGTQTFPLVFDGRNEQRTCGLEGGMVLVAGPTNLCTWLIDSQGVDVPLIVQKPDTDSAAKKTEYSWDHKPGAELALRAGKKTIWAYHFKADGGFPYVHPLATSDGTCLTALAPKDHPWHRAVWFSWKYLDGVNYWNWEGDSKQPIPPGQTVPVGKETVSLEADRAKIAMNLHYTTEGRTVLKEKREIIIRVPRDDGSYTMDWQATFTAAEKDVVLDRTPIPGQPKGAGHGGYAGLSFRGAESLREPHSIDSEGRRDMQSHGKTARWLDYHAVIDEKDNTAGVAIFDHPDNFRHPSSWYICFGGMPYFSPALIFQEPHTLPAGETLTLRYRILVHPGLGDPQSLEREYKEFSSSE